MTAARELKPAQGRNRENFPREAIRVHKSTFPLSFSLLQRAIALVTFCRGSSSSDVAAMAPLRARDSAFAVLIDPWGRHCTTCPF